MGSVPCPNWQNGTLWRPGVRLVSKTLRFSKEMECGSPVIDIDDIEIDEKYKKLNFDYGG